MKTIHPLDKLTPLQTLSFLGVILFLGVFVVFLGERKVSLEMVSGAWEIAFSDPKNRMSLDFNMYQKEKKQTFSYEVLCGREVVFSGDVSVNFDERTFVDIDETKILSGCEANLRTVEVKDASEEKRSIYRFVRD